MQVICYSAVYVKILVVKVLAIVLAFFFLNQVIVDGFRLVGLLRLFLDWLAYFDFSFYKFREIFLVKLH